MTPQTIVEDKTNTGRGKHVGTQIIQRIRTLGYTKKGKMDFGMEAVQTDFGH